MQKESRKLSLPELEKELMCITKQRTFHIFYDKERNNLIVLSPWADKEKIYDIYEYTPKDAYNHLINEFKNNQNLVVHWSKNKGEPSGYVLYYDIDPKPFMKTGHTKVTKYLRKLLNDSPVFKYTEVRDGEVKEIQL